MTDNDLKRAEPEAKDSLVPDSRRLTPQMKKKSRRI
jgi:hypothetical protein